MITIEMLENTSLKMRLTKQRDQMKTAGDNQLIGRQPETVVGFMTKQQVDNAYRYPTPGQLINDAGVSIISNQLVYFFCDDSGYGSGILPRDFTGFCFPEGLPYNMMPRPAFPDGTVRTAEELAAVFCRGEQYIGSLEELVKYVNKNYYS